MMSMYVFMGRPKASLFVFEIASSTALGYQMPADNKMSSMTSSSVTYFNTVGVITLFVIVAIIAVVIIIIVFAMRRWRRSTNDATFEDDTIDNDMASVYTSPDLNK